VNSSPSRRSRPDRLPGLLVAGHAAVFAGILLLVVLFVAAGVVAAATVPPVLLPASVPTQVAFVVGLTGLAAAQLLAIRLARAMRTAADALAAAVRRSALPVFLAPLGLLAGPRLVVRSPPLPSLEPLLVLLVAASLLLSAIQIAGIYRRLAVSGGRRARRRGPCRG
jgi:hypothetical protein